MSEGASGDNVIGVRTVYDAVLRLEGKLDNATTRFDSELDAHKQTVASELEAIKNEQTYQKGRMDGSLGMIKWIGPTGIAALIIGMLVMTGILHTS